MANNQLIASDNFASGSLAAGWGTFSILSQSQITGSPFVAEPNSTGTNAGQLWTALGALTDQISEVTTGTFTSEANTILNLTVRFSSSIFSGYAVQLTNGAWSILKWTNSVSASLASGSGLTFAAGDVWTFSAAGSLLSLYQNGRRVGYIVDNTYTSGYFGFYQLATGAVTHMQIASWRGYNAIQQDGIWQKQSIVLAPSSAEANALGWGVYEGSCIQDGNPQILSQSPVYKLWFTAGATGSQSVYYAESLDLKTWSRYGSAVLANFTAPQVIRVSGTYHMYCQPQATQGSGNIAHYTSSDGLNWSQQSANVLALGAGGTWDATGIDPLKPIANINGTWYALYGGFGTSSSYHVGLATSPDLNTWTKYAGNPVISPQTNGPAGVYPFPCWALVNGTYYVWMQVGPSSLQDSTVGNYVNPGETARYSTTDFIHWSGPVHSIHHSQMWEGVNTPTSTGQAMGANAPIAIFDINGKANMLVGMASGDIIQPSDTQYSLAIAPASIASIVKFNEDAVQQTATESFTEGVGSLPSPWATFGGFSAFKIVSGNLCEPGSTGGVNCGAAYTGISSSNQYSEITLQTVSADTFLSPSVYSGMTSCYYVAISGIAFGTAGFVAQITRYTGSNTTLGPAVGITMQQGDVLRLSVVQGTAGPIISLFQNGSLITQTVDLTSSALVGGNPGFVGSETTAGHTQISLWAGGNANVTPNYPPTSGASSSWLTTALANSLRGLKH